MNIYVNCNRFKEITKTRIQQISFTGNLENNAAILVIIGETKKQFFSKETIKVFLDSLKIVWIKITTFFKRRISIIL